MLPVSFLNYIVIFTIRSYHIIPRHMPPSFTNSHTLDKHGVACRQYSRFWKIMCKDYIEKGMCTCYLIYMGNKKTITNIPEELYEQISHLYTKLLTWLTKGQHKQRHFFKFCPRAGSIFLTTAYQQSQEENLCHNKQSGTHDSITNEQIHLQIHIEDAYACMHTQVF